MKVLIANPPWIAGDRCGVRAGSRWPSTSKKEKVDYKNRYMPFPFNLAYAAAVLEDAGHKVKVIDGIAEDLSKKEFVQRAKRVKPEIFFMECATASIYADLKWAEIMKHELNCPIIFAGTHITALPKEVLASPNIDYGLLGEYEYTFRELLNRLERKKPISKVLGLAYKRGKKVIINERRPLLDYNELPMPARHLFNMKLYHDTFCLNYPTIQVMTSRGCPFNCIFCLEPNVWYGPRWRVRSLENVRKEISQVIEDYKPKEIYFDDSTFTVREDRTISISRLMREFGLPWSCMTSVNTIRSKKMLEEMARGGCYRVKFGLESAHPKVLKFTGKPYNLRHVVKALKWANDVGIGCHITMMVGLPGETKTTMKRTFNFAKKLALDGLVESIQWSIATPYPGTKFYKMCVDNKWIVSKDWSKYDGSNSCVINYKNLSKNEIEEHFKNLESYWRYEVLNANVILKKIMINLKTKGIKAIPYLSRRFASLLMYKLRK